MLLANGFLGSNNRSCFHAVTCLPLVRKHLDVESQYGEKTIWKDSAGDRRLRHLGGRESPDDVLGHHTYSIDTIAVNFNTKFHFNTVHACDWPRQRQRKFVPSADLTRCYTCSRRRYDKEKEQRPTCTWNTPWDQGHAKTATKKKRKTGTKELILHDHSSDDQTTVRRSRRLNSRSVSYRFVE